MQPVNAYHLILRAEVTERPPSLVWQTVEDGRAVDYEEEPARSAWQRLKINFLSLLPFDSEL